MGCLVGWLWRAFFIGVEREASFQYRAKRACHRAGWIRSHEDSPLRVVVVTDIPSPYQVELFDAVANLRNCDLTVIYVRRSATERMWNAPPISHNHRFLFETAASEVSSEIV